MNSPSRPAILPQHEDIPVLVLRGGALYPGAVAPFKLERDARGGAVLTPISTPPTDGKRDDRIASAEGLLLGSFVAVLCAREDSIDSREDGTVHAIGCVARVLVWQESDTEGQMIVLQGVARIQYMKTTQPLPDWRATFAQVPEQHGDDDDSVMLAEILLELSIEVVRLKPEIPREAIALFKSLKTSGELCDLIASQLNLSVEKKVLLLQITDVKERLCHVVAHAALSVETLELLKDHEARVLDHLKRVSPGPSARKSGLHIERGALLDALETQSATPHEARQTPDSAYRTAHNPTEVDRIDLSTPVEEQNQITWMNALRILGIGRKYRTRRRVHAQLQALRSRHRSKALAFLYEFVERELAREL